jgi:hypothetical protein
MKGELRRVFDYAGKVWIKSATSPPIKFKRGYTNPMRLIDNPYRQIQIHEPAFLFVLWVGDETERAKKITD